MLQVISLGAGVQSTTMLLMAVRGEFDGECPPYAIFADTGWEPKAVYDHLDWLENEVKGKVEIIRVSAGNIKERSMDAIEGRRSRFVTVPAFTQSEKGTTGQLRRQCTKEFKLEPIIKAERAMMGIGKGQRAPKTPQIEQWIGISLDEVVRMKPSLEAWKVHRWPLVEKRLARTDCLLWMERHGYPRPPKSACIGCPFHDNRMWRDMKDNDQESWWQAVEFDKAIRRLPRFRENIYLHADRVPLDQVDLTTPQDRGQQEMSFNDECEGMCGV